MGAVRFAARRIGGSPAPANAGAGRGRDAGSCQAGSCAPASSPAWSPVSDRRWRSDSSSSQAGLCATASTPARGVKAYGGAFKAVVGGAAKALFCFSMITSLIFGGNEVEDPAATKEMQ
ncbi:uncharacterized protein [Triticum aestivum]|uniref:uncharacterized protein n=1 Tax=Triticum aestivum TaxID=4565 RepID=UPI001D0252D4|nr:uncharacterized protein LOC123183219 [Triticum aestivum]